MLRHNFFQETRHAFFLQYIFEVKIYFLMNVFLYWWSPSDVSKDKRERDFWISWPFLSVSLYLIKLKRLSITVHSCLLRWAYSQAGWLTVSLYSSLAMTSRALWKGPLFCARLFHCVLWNTDNLKIKQRRLNARRKNTFTLSEQALNCKKEICHF